MTRLTRDKGSLQYDDRLDVLAMGVQYWWEQMAQDEHAAYKERQQEEFMDGIMNFMNTVNETNVDESVWTQAR